MLQIDFQKPTKTIHYKFFAYHFETFHHLCILKMAQPDHAFCQLTRLFQNLMRLLTYDRHFFFGNWIIDFFTDSSSFLEPLNNSTSFHVLYNKIVLSLNCRNQRTLTMHYRRVDPHFTLISVKKFNGDSYRRIEYLNRV